MNRCPRHSVAVPAVLLSANATAEKQRAVDYYAGFPLGLPGYQNFSIYRDVQVKDALKLLFCEKCAYCESSFVNHGVHVEHFRPHGKVHHERGGIEYIGYWWLASDWGNLLPTCLDCNIAANHELPDGTLKVVGKGNYFPLRNQSKRARSKQFLPNEVPMLIDPSRDHPQRYLEFLYAGKTGSEKSLVRAKSSLVDITAVEKAETSIDGYGLNRLRLVSERTKRIRLLEVDLVDWRAQMDDVKFIDDPERRSIASARITRRLEGIMTEFISSKSPYSVACFSFIKNWLKVNSVLAT